MNINDSYIHKHIEGLTCEIVAFTAKGVKVKQKEGKKEKQAFYNMLDFEESPRGLWTKNVKK